MPAISISNPFKKECLPEFLKDKEIHIYLYNRMCALEQRINKLQTIIEEQCEHCQYKKVAENIKTILN